MRTLSVLALLFGAMLSTACQTGPRTPEQERESEEWFDHEASD